MIGGRAVLIAAALIAAQSWAAPASAQNDDDDPRFCPNRPSLNSSPCTVQPGKVLAELSFVDWQRDDRADSREDRILSGDSLVRLGVGANTELQLGWTAFGHDRERDKMSGAIDRVDGIGDVTLALRQNLTGNDAKPLGIGVQPFVSLPAGRYPIGAGTWAAGVLVPVQYDLAKSLEFQFTGQAEAAANESGRGRHLAYRGIAGLAYKLSGAVTMNAELSLERDRDPSGHETHALAALSAAWQPTKRTQLDVLAVAGLNRTSPDVQLVFGGAVLF